MEGYEISLFFFFFLRASCNCPLSSAITVCVEYNLNGRLRYCQCKIVSPWVKYSLLACLPYIFFSNVSIALHQFTLKFRPKNDYAICQNTLGRLLKSQQVGLKTVPEEHLPPDRSARNVFPIQFPRPPESRSRAEPLAECQCRQRGCQADTTRTAIIF